MNIKCLAGDLLRVKFHDVKSIFIDYLYRRDIVKDVFLSSTFLEI